MENMVHLGTLKQSCMQDVSILHLGAYVEVKGDVALLHLEDAFKLWYDLFPSLQSAITSCGKKKRMLDNMKPAYHAEYIRDCENRPTPTDGMKGLRHFHVYSMCM
jgi:hypothetical protein